MNTQYSNQKIPDREVRKYFKGILPKEEYMGAHPSLLLFGFLQVFIILSCIWMCAHYTHPLVIVAAGLIMGNSLYALGNFCHHLSHRALFKNKQITYFFELIFWSVGFASTTVWNKIHTKYHHHNTNGPQDTFRYFSKSELTKSRERAHQILSPTRKSLFTPVFLLSYFPYILTCTFGALLGRSGSNSSIVSYMPAYTVTERIKIFFEMMFYTALHVAIFVVSGISLEVYLVVVGIAMAVSSAINTFYVYSQHSLYPLSEENDSLHNSTTMIVPSWVDKLHLYSSLHVEHHLFPSMSPTVYPKVSNILSQEFGEHYDKRPWREVWDAILDQDLFKDDIVKSASAKD